ncbi:phage major capsid protein [Clostridioides sp. ZZV14-6154]|uniref:phage major capsid protein n=1 Tax=unclassified Clostridioides TaxID=2635829 RepID=UPI001D1236C1|nr:phage major capsid protein [Clostridioides sp. ZZV14-6150]MCC0659096.1 phage major capsid protein [Clostridioides sp. ZZV14-6154]
MNRYQLEQMKDGVKEQLKIENENLSKMYLDSKTTMEARQEQQKIVKDLDERFEGIKNKIKENDDREAQQIAFKNKNKNLGNSEKDIKINAKAELIRNVMSGKEVTKEIKNVLGDGDALGGGNKILPTTMTNELLYEPMSKNPLRGISTMTNITNLEIPKIIFSLDDDDFLDSDSASAKELNADGANVSFDRNKFKVFCDITETVLKGTETNLVQVVDAGLQSGLAKKEKKVAFESNNPTEMSFYKKSTESGNPFLIKSIEGDTLFEAIINCLADLEDDYSENASVVMRKVDYFKIIKTLANGNASLYTAQPEQVLGVPVIYCDLATIPVVGDFRYSHFNYDLEMFYDRDKNVKTGIESFVLTAYLDHKIKMKSAFRLATVKSNTP